MPKKKLSPKCRKAAAKLYAELSKHFEEVGHDCGCNDWEVKDTPEHREILKQMVYFNFADNLKNPELKTELEEYSTPSRKGWIFVPDFYLWDYLQELAKESIGRP